MVHVGSSDSKGKSVGPGNYALLNRHACCAVGLVVDRLRSAELWIIDRSTHESKALADIVVSDEVQSAAETLVESNVTTYVTNVAFREFNVIHIVELWEGPSSIVWSGYTPE